MKNIGLIDYEFGNTQSLCNALDALNCKFTLCSTPESLEQCSHIILPGVGSFNSTMESLKKLNLINSLNKIILTKKIFFLGICVGFQVIFSEGYEFKNSKGLGWIKGKCQKINNIKNKDLKLPHTGWNEVQFPNKSKLFKNIEEDKNFYFVHSFCINSVAIDKNILLSYSFYGDNFVSSVQKENIYGVQFHPEKSQKNGLQLLKNFTNLNSHEK
jgi:imidazole glycerol-phosphate synthase subunit HisH